MEEKSFFRQWCILQSIYAHANRGISLSTLARERGVSKKTIQRDISYLSSLSFPIYSENISQNNQVIYKMLPHYRFPSISFNQEEFLTLLFMFKSAHPLQSYFDDVVKNCFDKMHSQSSPELLKFYQKVWNSILPDTKSTIVWNQEESKNLKKILQSLIQGKKLYFKYNSVLSNTEKEHLVTVLCLKIHENNIYIAAFSKERKAILIYAINRMRSTEIVSEPRDNVEFNAQKFFEDSFGIYAGKPFQVKLLFSEKIAAYIKERIWHPKQKVKLLDDGKVLLQIPATSINEIKKYVLSYGANVKVLEPQELIDEIKKPLKEINELY